MTVWSAQREGPRDPVLLFCLFAAAVSTRVLIGGAGAARSAPAGAIFAVLLVAVSLAARTVVPVSTRAVLAGLGGAVVLCLPVLVARGQRPLHEQTGFTSWALLVAFVAVAEEVFLRGTLYDAVARTRGDGAAVAAGAIAFALLHVPLYGWSVVPLDLAVGVLLGRLRMTTGTAAAPAVAHTTADLAGWFLR